MLGIRLDDRTAIAFPVDAVRSVLAEDGDLAVGAVSIRPDGGDFAAESGVDEIATHEAFRFA